MPDHQPPHHDEGQPETAAEMLLTYRLTHDQKPQDDRVYQKVQRLLGDDSYTVLSFAQTAEHGATAVTVHLGRRKPKAAGPPDTGSPGF